MRSILIKYRVAYLFCLAALFAYNTYGQSVVIDNITYTKNNDIANVSAAATTITSANILDNVDISGVTLPVTNISESAFIRCTELVTVVIPNSITLIGDNAFYYCIKLSEINIPPSVLTIGEEAFSLCISATKLSLNTGLETIDTGAFSGCAKLTSITIPETVTSIGDGAFYSCSAITDIYSLATRPPSISENTFYGITATLYVPTGDKTAYEGAEYWSNFSNVVESDFASTKSIDATDNQIYVYRDAVIYYGGQKPIKIFNVNGILAAESNNSKCDISNLEKGIYIVVAGGNSYKFTK